MATDKTESKKDQLNRLFKENNLIAEDYYAHKHYTIITRSGIEKIQYKNNITIGFEAVKMEPDFCVVKAMASKPVGKEVVKVETFGSAGHGAKGEADQGKLKTNQYAYYPELAEKRALSRAVLKITNFYELGVFGEDEADDFKQKTEPAKAEPAPAMKAQPAPVVIIKSEAADTPPPAVDEPVEATSKQKEEIIRLLNNKVITSAEKNKMLLNLGKLNQDRAAESIAKLNQTINERETNKAA